MLGLWDHHSMAWYQAEKQEGQVAWTDLPRSRRDEIRARVKRVLRGEVARGQCSIGDLIVLEGRNRVAVATFRNPFKQGIRTSRGMTPEELEYMPRLHGVTESSWDHYYDTLPVGDGYQLQACNRLFGNCNIGDYGKTNLQVAGFLASDQTFFFQSQYLTAEGFDEVQEPLVRQVLETSKFTSLMGDRPQAMYSGWDLFTEPRPYTAVLPVRQHVSVEVSFYSRAYAQLDEQCRKYDLERRRPRFVFHYEGWRTRDVA